MTEQHEYAPKVNEVGSVSYQPAGIKRSGTCRLKIAAILWVLLIVFGLSVAKQFIVIIEDYIRSLGVLGWFLYFILCVTGALICNPYSLWAAFGGFLFGWRVGAALCYAGTCTGACLCFLIGRMMLHDFVERKQRENVKLAAFLAALDQFGAKVIFLSHLSPLVPFFAVSYGPAVSTLPFRSFVFPTIGGVIPLICFWAFTGSAVRDLQDILDGKTEGGLMETVFVVVTVLISTVGIVVVSFQAKKILAKYLADENVLEDTQRRSKPKSEDFDNFKIDNEQPPHMSPPPPAYNEQNK